MLRALGTRMANRSGEPPRVIVVGGGVAGLAAAYTLHRERPDWDVLLLEKSDRLGGNIRTDRHHGFLIDAGPDSFIRTKPEALELCRELGIDGELIGTEEAARHAVEAFVQRTLGGSITPFVAYLADREQVSDEELAELETLLSQLQQGRRKKR